MRAPRLVIVSGAPGAGKSTLARLLATELRIALIGRDVIKEALMDSLGCDTPARSAELGRASYAVMYAVVHRVLDAGADVIVETNFRRADAEPDLRGLVAKSDAVLVHCDSSNIEKRFLDRPRHSGHHGGAVVGRLMEELEAGVFEPVSLAVPMLRVNCSAGYQPQFGEVVDFAKTRRLA